VPEILPQQLLLLELLVMSGDIAVAHDTRTTILGRTLEECEAKGWTVSKVFGQGFNKVSITDRGRQMVSRAKTAPA